ncbi:hypothetical protein [Streptomyces sp. MS2.AVA.5]|uniref:Uncharacterized protein n=1 Tax=Streptomyces achmelvichensis TaxID=3134111 RepID=A0ACC6Q7M8_9ACTN
MKRAISGLLSAALLSGVLIAGTGTASADTTMRATAATAPPVVMVDPIGEQRSMCTVY